MDNSEIGLIGLGVMGKSLALNLTDKSVILSVYNREIAGKEENIAANFVSDNPGKAISGFNDLKDFVHSLDKPRNILLLIKPGEAIDSVINELAPLLDHGDLLIDGGNSHFEDTNRREGVLLEMGILYMGVGISGGEAGARDGCSIMSGGSIEAYNQAQKYLELVAARDKENRPCSLYCGPDGAGHFVKMVHNGIEYAEMQLLAEIYYLLRHYLEYDNLEISGLLEKWQKNGADSYLLNITIDILRKKEGDEFLIDKVLDVAGQKGTGVWSAITSLKLGISSDTSTAALLARLLSGNKTERIKAEETYQLPDIKINKSDLDSESLRNAYQAARIINHVIGFNLLGKASQHFAWPLKLCDVARTWTAGCIIKSELMTKLVDILADSRSQNLLVNPQITELMKSSLDDLSNVISTVLKSGCAMPVMSSAANFFYGYTSGQSPANLIQLQRDYFGAHGYSRIDAPPDTIFHTDWSRSVMDKNK